VAVVGKLRLSEWSGRDGDKRSHLQVVADAVQFLGKPTRPGDPDGAVVETDNSRPTGPPSASTAKPADLLARAATPIVVAAPPTISPESRPL
jgi:single-stranded DNA-binding protein